MLEREAPTVFGIQEGYLFQVKYIEENLPQYGRVGVGRDDGKEGGGESWPSSTCATATICSTTATCG